jgi:hypothetical protein
MPLGGRDPAILILRSGSGMMSLKDLKGASSYKAEWELMLILW